MQGHIQGGPEPTGVAIMPDPPAVPPVDFDVEDKDDGAKAQDNARLIRVEFEPNDIIFWFSQLEDEMLLGSVNSQWLKKSVLQRNLPNKQKEDVKALLVIPKSQAGNNIYKRIKNEIIRIYAPKEQDSYQKALQRTMVGLPSQLGQQIINDICKKNPKLQGCCCARATQALWSLQLPVHVRAHISDRDFNETNYREIFEAADKCYLSAKQVSIAAVATPNPDETLPAFDPQNQPQQEVAAVKQQGRGGQRGGRGGNRGGRGNRGGQGRGGGQRGGRNQNQGGGQGGAQPRPPRHSSNPPEQCCDRHYAHGADSWYCLAPLTCPWANRIKPRPT